MNTKIKVLKGSDGDFIINQLKLKQLSYIKLGHLIREGYAFDVQTVEGFDITKETLAKIAFLHSSKEDVIDALGDLMGEELLYTIIENGGIESYITRRARGAIFE